MSWPKDAVKEDTAKKKAIANTKNLFSHLSIWCSYLELVHPDDLEIARSGLEGVIEGRSGPNEFRMKARSGETRWVRTFTRPVRIDGSVVRLRGVLTDITDQKLAEMALRRSETLLARMTDASPFGYYVVDTRTDGILYFNDRFLEIWGLRDLRDGLRRGEVRNRDLAGRLLTLVSDPDAFAASSLPLRDAENRAEVEAELALADGRTIRRLTAESGTTRIGSTAGSTSSRISPNSSA